MSKSKYLELLGKVANIAKQRNQPPAKVVVVSKTRTPEEIMSIYEEGCRDFGENYVEELAEKSVKLPSDIRWHFVGHLQSNKIKKVLIDNLAVLETVDRVSVAEKLNKELSKSQRQLDVLVQVQTSSEETKHGCKPEEAVEVARYVHKDCRWLNFKGLMTIGQQGDSAAFEELFRLRETVRKQLEIEPRKLQLSMGMSGDFERAIQHGSTIIRVGTLVFGPRPKKHTESPESV